MRDNFKGWKSVYAFTFQQAAKGAGFKLITLLIALLMFGGFVLMNVIMAKPDKNDKDEPSPIKAVYVLDKSGLQPANYKASISQLEGKKFKHIDFVTIDKQSSDEVIKTAASDSSEAIAVIVSAKDSGYELQAVIPEYSKITKKQAEELLVQMVSAFQANKLMQAGLSPNQLMSVLKPAVVSLSDIGENTSEATKVIKMVAPMIFSFMLYFMLIVYGQTISKTVSTEKTSKLMEVLLTSIHPYAMIAGKVLAITSMALLQFVIWIAAAFAGLYGGNALAHRIYPQYENTVITIINFLKDNIGQSALSTPAIILAIFFFCLGFLFYNTLAALAGCMVSKPEDVASTQAIFQFPIIISWLVSYFAPLLGNKVLITADRFIPFTAPFTVPVDLITGSMGLSEGLLSTALLLAFSLLTIMLSARIYKGLVLYNGQKLSFKIIGNILRTNK